MPGIKYILYARKSSESEDRQIQSIDDQVNRLQELAALMHLDVVDVLTEAKSAKRPGVRPVFEEVLRRIEAGEADGILCWQINRLSRNPMDSGRLQMILQDGILKSIRTFDREYQPSDNVLLFSVESGMANQFIIDLRKNTIRGLDCKLSKGWLPAVPPNGYLNDVLAKTIVKDPVRFPLVRKMWDLMLTGNYNPTEVVRIANEDWGFRTVKRSRRGDSPLATSAAYRIFQNKFYAGVVCYDGKEYAGSHEPMVTMDEFEYVQEVFGRKGKHRPQTHEFAFTGLIRCGHCGCSVTAEEKTKTYKNGRTAKYVYYRCSRRKRDIECHEPAVTLAELEGQIAGEIKAFTLDPDFFDLVLSIIRGGNDKEIESRNKTRAVLEASYADLQRQLDNLTRMRYRDMIDDATFTKERETLQQELGKAKRRLDETHDRCGHWIETTEQAFFFAARAHERFLNGGLKTKREILATIGTDYVLKDGKLTLKQHDWLIPISNAVENAKTSPERLEPALVGSTQNKNTTSCEVMSLWGG